MTLVENHVEIRWRSNTREWYENKGYVWTNKGESFLVNIEDALPSTEKHIDIICDYCDNIFTRRFSSWLTGNTTSPIKKDACRKCTGKKTKESNLLVYGVENITQLESVKNKIAETNLDKYGVKVPLQNKEILNKVHQTNLERYGVKVPAKNKEVVEKIKNTNLEKYGATTYFHSEEGSEHIKKVINDRFGVDNVSQSDLIKAKKNMTMYKNSSTPTSSQQLHIHSLVGGELNYPFGRASLDIAFVEDNIYLEYDGGGHNLDVKLNTMTQEEFDKKEQKRSFFLKGKGWKEIRIISDNDKLYSDEDIINFVDIAKYLINSDKWFSVHWNMDIDLVKINYTHTYSLQEYFTKYGVKEELQ